MSDHIIHINKPITDDNEIEAAAAVLRSGILTSPAREGGPAVRQLERAVEEFTGARHAVAVSSGTAALHVALLAAGIGHGDEVIVPSFSYVATANAVAASGASVVFVDITSNHTMDPESLSSALTDKTRAVIPVHLYGMMAHIDEINEIVAGRDITIIEDAAQSLGTTRHGRHAGNMADAGCYSLYPGKVATSGEGGVVVTGNDYTYERLLSLRNHGNGGGAFDTFGLNLRMPEVCAAIGAVQMGKLSTFLKARRRNAQTLTKMLEGTDVGLPRPGSGEDPNWNLYTITTPRRDALLKDMKRGGVGAAIYYKTPIHMMPHYNANVPLPNTQYAAQTVLSLPVHPEVDVADLERMTSLVGG